MIEDFYGSIIEVQPVMASPGPMVDVEFGRPASPVSGGKPTQDFVRLTKEQAVELGEALVEAGSE